MPEITLRGVTKRFGKVTAVHALDLQIGDGEFIALLGPSGCGKTTVLRMLAGLEEPDEGEIWIGSEAVCAKDRGVFVPPGNRNVGMIFQSYALWPHMTVFENIAFGLQIARLPREEIRSRVAAVLDLLQLGGFEDRYMNEMSGGQQQRVALARMLVTRPQVFLMDEPLSNLDAKLRLEMRAELKTLHTRLGTTCVYVTHDQVEALTLATRIAVLNNGVLQQFGTPMDVYKTPANLFVADFMGNPTTNMVEGVVADGVVRPVGLPLQIELPAGSARVGTGAGSDRVVVVIRPEDLILARDAGPGAAEAHVESTLPTGAEVIVRVRCGTAVLTARVQEADADAARVGPGSRVWVRPRHGAVNVYDARSGVLVHACV